MANLGGQPIDINKTHMATHHNMNIAPTNFKNVNNVNIPLYDYHETNSLKIFHQNICGLSNKSNELLISLLPNPPQVLCLTEHHSRSEEIVNRWRLRQIASDKAP
jgi:hypothetical protein